MTANELQPTNAGVIKPYHWIALVAILLLATGLRVHRLSAESFWIDELYMVEYTAANCHADFEIPRDQVVEAPPRLTSLDGAGSPARIWTSLRDDQHPPLYYVLLRLWRDAFGSSEAGLRSLSVVASVAAVALIFDVGRLLFSPGVALWACTLMAVAQGQIRYAQEARSYMVLTAFVLAAAGAIVRIERYGPNARRGAALFASLLAIVLTHYYGVAGCLAVGAYALIRLRGKTRARTIGIMFAAAAVYAIIWGPLAVQQLSGYAIKSDWLAIKAEDAGTPLLAWVRRLLGAPIRFFADPSFRRPGVLPWVVALVLVLPVLRLRRIPGLLLPTLWATAWIALPAVLDLVRGTRQVDFPRYLLGAAPAVYLSMAALLSDAPRVWFRHVIPAAFALYCVVSLPWTYDYPKAEWRRLGQDVGRLASDQDLILYHTPAIGDWFAGVMYLAVEHYAPHLRVPTAIMTAPATRDVLARANGAHAVWLATDSSGDHLKQILPGFRPADNYFQWGVGMLYRMVPDVPPPPPPATAPSPAPAAGTGTSSTPTTRGT